MPTTSEGRTYGTNSTRVLVGIDGSEASQRALEWAAAYAHSTGARLHTMSAWIVPSNYGVYVAGPDWDVGEAAHKLAEEQVAPIRDRYPDLDITLSVVHDHPSHALVEASVGAGLLVVGTRGHGGFTGLILGSVSAHCVHAAHCPVVVFR